MQCQTSAHRAIARHEVLALPRVAAPIRVLRLGVLAPDIFEAILDGQQPKALRFQELLQPFSAA